MVRRDGVTCRSALPPDMFRPGERSGLLQNALTVRGWGREPEVGRIGGAGNKQGKEGGTSIKEVNNIRKEWIVAYCCNHIGLKERSESGVGCGG